MKRQLISLFCAGFALLGSNQTLADNSYKIGISDSFQPFNYRDAQGQLKGFNVDVANALCTEMKAKCEFVVMRFPQIIPALENNEVQFAPANFLITAERAKKINFSAKYYRSTTSLIGSADKAHLDPEQVLKDMNNKVGTQKGSAQNRYLVEHAHTQVIELSSIGEGLSKLNKQEIDYLIAPTLFALNFLQRPENSRMDFIGEPINNPTLSGSVHIGITKQQPELQQKIDTALAALVKQGKLRQIINQYFPFNVY